MIQIVNQLLNFFQQYKLELKPIIIGAVGTVSSYVLKVYPFIDSLKDWGETASYGTQILTFVAVLFAVLKAIDSYCSKEFGMSALRLILKLFKRKREKGKDR